jgi:hypothetical protein
MKILYFDYWTKGWFNFKDIDKKLKEKNHETVLLHVDSFRDVKYENFEECNIYTIEIKALNTNMVFNALAELKPDVIITLNTTGLLDRSLVLAARKLNIKTVFLMHGLIPVGDKLENEIKLNTKINQISYKLNKSIKYLKYYIPNYLYSLYKYDYKLIFKFKWLEVLHSHFDKPYRTMYFPLYPFEILQDKCLIYSKAFFNYYSEVGYDRENIITVGNPTYNELFKKIEESSFSLFNLPDEVIKIIDKSEKYAVYIDDGLYIYSYDNWDYEYMKNHLKLIADRLLLEKIKLVVKVRPSTDIVDIFIDHPNILYYKDVSFYDLVYFSTFAIGHISTAMNIPVILNKPIIVPKFGKSKSITDYYVGNGVANSWVDINSDLNFQINQEIRKLYIDEYITIVDSKSVERVIHEIESLN